MDYSFIRGFFADVLFLDTFFGMVNTQSTLGSVLLLSLAFSRCVQPLLMSGDNPLTVMYFEEDVNWLSPIFVSFLFSEWISVHPLITICQTHNIFHSLECVLLASTPFISITDCEKASGVVFQTSLRASLSNKVLLFWLFGSSHISSQPWRRTLLLLTVSLWPRAQLNNFTPSSRS